MTKIKQSAVIAKLPPDVTCGFGSVIAVSLVITVVPTMYHYTSWFKGTLTKSMNFALVPMRLLSTSGYYSSNLLD